MAAEENKKEYLTYSTDFRRNAILLIDKMMEMAADTQEDTSELVDEILHSIFFLGKINHPEFSPEELLDDDDDDDENLFESLKEAFPEPFRLYSSRLPRRSPFSCVLDMVVHLKGAENEDEIRKTLQELTTELIDSPYEASYSTICVSYDNNTDSVVYLKEQEDEDKIRTILEKVVQELMENPSKKASYSTICISPSNTDTVVHLKGAENEDEIRKILQELAKKLMENASKKLFFPICVSHGNCTVKVVQPNRQEDKTVIRTMEKLVKELMENPSNKACSTVYVSHGNRTIYVRQKNKTVTRRILKKLTRNLMGNPSNEELYSTTVCVSHGNSTDSVRHYGVSMSTTGPSAGKILVAASCLNYWEDHVADAVMSYYPKKTRKSYFDVTIKLPDGVRCEAFDTKSGEVKIPCCSCRNMFGLDTTVTKEWAYGNCAEAESLSNLLGEEGIRERVQRNGNWTEEKREKAIDDVKYHLRSELENVGFSWDNQFYHCKMSNN